MQRAIFTELQSTPFIYVGYGRQQHEPVMTFSIMRLKKSLIQLSSHSLAMALSFVSQPIETVRKYIKMCFESITS